jgi:large subunit ribosomal protein L25
MSAEKITAEIRTEFGKGAARRVRRENKIPAVVYGYGDPVHLTLPGHATMMALRHGGANALLELDIEGETKLALAKDVQVDPIRRVIEHVDLFEVKRGEKVVVEVPVQVVGQAAPDTLVVTDAAAVQIEVEATHVPEHIEVSVAGAQPGTLIHAADLVLPEGAVLVSEGDVLIINVAAQVSAEALEADLAEAPGAEAAAAPAEAPEGE